MPTPTTARRPLLTLTRLRPMREPPCSLSEAVPAGLSAKVEKLSRPSHARAHGKSVCERRLPSWFLSRLLLDAVGREAAKASVRNQHTERNIMVKHGELGDELVVEGEPTRGTDELLLGEESVVEPHAATDAVPLGAEAEAGDDDEVD